MATAYVDDKTSQHNLRFSDIADEPLKVLLPIEGYETMPLVSLEEAVDPLLHLLPDIQRKVWVAKQNSDNPADALSSDESASICIYSMEWKPRDECLYVVLNATLRDKNREKLKPWFLYLKLLLTALSRLPSSRMTVYRGIKLNLIENYPKGKTFVWWGFSSCTSSIDVLQSELFLGKTEIRTMFTIDCFSGKDIQRHSYYETENEVLLLAATQFLVIASLDQGNGLHIIQLKEIDPPFPLLQPVSESNISLNTTPLNQSNANLPSFTVKTMTTSLDKYRNPKLVEMIDRFPSQSSADLRHQHLSDRDIPIVNQQAIINKQCKTLWLEDNQLKSKGAFILASVLGNNTTLKILRLNNNALYDKGVKYLAQTLALNNSLLNTLDLGENNIKDEGAGHLAEMLKTNTTLTHLHLSKNEIGNEGIKLLANILAHHNTSLKLLDLHGNKLVSDLSVDPLIQMLKHNQSLEKLSVRDCNLSWESKSKLKEAVREKMNFSLRL